MRNPTTCFTEEDLIRPDQIELITGLDEEGAQREYDYILKSIDANILSIGDYCQLFGYDCQEVIGFLNPTGSALENYYFDTEINEFDHGHTISH